MNIEKVIFLYPYAYNLVKVAQNWLLMRNFEGYINSIYFTCKAIITGD